MKRFAPLLLLLLTACAGMHPNVSLKGPAKPPVQVAQVRIVNTPVEGAREMALVYAWSNTPVDSRAGYDYAALKLRERAASIGADAVWVPPFKEVEYPRHSQWTGMRKSHEGDYDRPTELIGKALDLPDGDVMPICGPGKKKHSR